MSKKKKSILIIVSVVAAIALIVGAIVLIPNLNQKEVEVYPVERIREYSWGDQLGSYGNIMAGNMQAVYLDAELLLESIDVEVGDEVSIGDTLLCYDMTIQNLNIKTIRINIDILTNKIKKAEQDLAAAKALVASEPPPPPPVPENPAFDGRLIEDLDHAESNGLISGGDGKENSPYIINSYEGLEVPATFLKSLYVDAGTGDPLDKKISCVEFRVYDQDNNVLMYKWKVSGQQLENFDPTTLPTDWSWNLSSGVSVDPSGPISVLDDKAPEPIRSAAVFTQLADTVDYIGGPHYSQAEIDRKVNDAENQLATLRTDMKQKKLDLEKAEAEAGDGTVKSEINGIVSEVNDPDNLESGQALIVVQSGKGYRVEGTVSELNLDKIEIGQMVTISSWSSGGSYVGEITEVMDFPARYGNSMGMENPINSYYTFVAMIDTEEVLTVGEYVDISIGGGSDGEMSDALYIPNAFVREENGQSYVMKADEEGKLVKQFIKTGKSLWGYSIEVKAGLTLQDNIAFPYGKQVKEGAPTVVAEGGLYG